VIHFQISLLTGRKAKNVNMISHFLDHIDKDGTKEHDFIIGMGSDQEEPLCDWQFFPKLPLTPT